MIHALKAERIGFIDVSNPPPWVGTAEGGLVTPFEVYRRGKTVLVKLEFSPHRSEEAEFAKSISDWAIGQKFKDAILIGGLDSAYKQAKEDFCVVPTGAYLDRAKLFKAPILEPGLLVYGPLAIMLNDFPSSQRLHQFRRDTPAILAVGDKEHVTGEECPDESCNILCLRLIERGIS